MIARLALALAFIAAFAACSDNRGPEPPERTSDFAWLIELGERLREQGIDEEFFASLEDEDWLEGATDIAERYDAIAAAFDNPCIGNDCAPDDVLRYGAWLQRDDTGDPVPGAVVQARGLPPAYATEPVTPTGSATYTGNAKGVGHWTEGAGTAQTRHAGEFTARVMLDYDFGSNRLAGVVDEWTGPGADKRWPDLGLSALGADGTGLIVGIQDGTVNSGITGQWTAVPYGGAEEPFVIDDGIFANNPVEVRQPPGYVGTFNADFVSDDASFGDGAVISGFDVIEDEPQ